MLTLAEVRQKAVSRTMGQQDETTATSAPSKRPKETKPVKRKRKRQEEDYEEETDYKYFKTMRAVRIGGRQPTSEKLEIYIQDLRRKVLSRFEHGLKVIQIDGKGRGVVADKIFDKEDFVVEYAGELISDTQARQREDLYEQDVSVGCYMYYFDYQRKHYCVDATKDSGQLGRLLNHSRKSFNCQVKVVSIGERPHLVVVASRRIEKGEELTFDYGDCRASAIMNHPWLKQ